MRNRAKAILLQKPLQPVEFTWPSADSGTSNGHDHDLSQLTNPRSSTSLPTRYQLCRWAIVVSLLHLGRPSWRNSSSTSEFVRSASCPPAATRSHSADRVSRRHKE